jgi:hypothetical protein
MATTTMPTAKALDALVLREDPRQTWRPRRSRDDVEEADQDATHLSPSGPRSDLPSPPPPPPLDTATIHRILDVVLCTTAGRNGCGGRRCRPPYAKPREAAAAVPPGLCPAMPMATAAGGEMPWDGLRRRGARGSPGQGGAATRERGGVRERG